MLTTLFDFAIGLVEDLLYIITLLPKVILSIPDMLVSFLPSSLVALLMVFISVTVIYRIMGRD